MTTSLQELKEALGVSKLEFYPSTTDSGRLVAYPPKTHSFSFIVMTKPGEQIDPEKEIYVTILEASDEYPWISDYDMAAVVSHKAPKAAALVL